VRVYNLTDQPLEYRGRTLPPLGGSFDFQELDSFVPDRDKELAKNKVVSFDTLPQWWKDQRRQATNAPRASVRLIDKVAVEDVAETKPVEKTFGKRR
jgi:hypothetical protein